MTTPKTPTYYAIKTNDDLTQTIAFWKGDRPQWKAVSKMQSTETVFRQVHQNLFPHEVDALIKWHRSMGAQLVLKEWADRPRGTRDDDAKKVKRPSPGAQQVLVMA